MSETATEMQAGATEGTTNTQEARTFTQEELNKIVEGRVARERAKTDAEYAELKAKASKFDEMEEASKSELQKATEKANKLQEKLNAIEKANEVRTIREKVSNETGVPVSLLSGNTEEECKTQAEGILKFAKPDGYPVVKDGGEVTTIHNKNASDQFADWFNASLK